tara:strand:- start:2353 stop:3399 length:1047 start_codon:yes stop_codon:yes gene_type:complete
MDCYKKKYLKYKTKYLDLKKNSIGGAVAAAMQNNKKSGPSSRSLSPEKKALFKKLEEEENAKKREKCNKKMMEIKKNMDLAYETGKLSIVKEKYAEAGNQLYRMEPSCIKDEIKKFRKSLEDDFKKRAPQESEEEKKIRIKKEKKNENLKKWKSRLYKKTKDNKYSEFGIMYIKDESISDADKKKYGDLAGVQILVVPLIGKKGIIEIFGKNTSKFYVNKKYCIHKNLERMFKDVMWGDVKINPTEDIMNYGDLKIKYKHGKDEYGIDYAKRLHLTHPDHIALISGKVTDKKKNKEENEKIHKGWLESLTKNNPTYKAIVDVLKKGEEEVYKNQSEAVRLYNMASKCF